MLKEEGLIAEEFIQKLLTWRHSGFSVYGEGMRHEKKRGNDITAFVTDRFISQGFEQMRPRP